VKQKILFIYDSMMIGGTSTALVSLMNSINREKYDISLLLYTNEGAGINEIPDGVHLLQPAYHQSPITFLTSGRRKIIRTIFNCEVFKALASYLKYRGTPKGNIRQILMHHGMKAQVSLSRTVKEHYDIAIGFMEGWSNQYVVSSKISADRRYVWIHPQYKNCYLIPEIDRPVLEKADGIALVSGECMQQFLTFFPQYADKTMVVPNILSAELVRKKAGTESISIAKGKMNFCTVCRCDMYVKGLDRILDALLRLKNDGLVQGVMWHLIGGGADLERLKRAVREKKLTDNVILYGNMKNPLPYLVEMNAFVLASRYEGKPMAVTEAQLLGLPCLVTNYASAHSQVRSGYNGYVMDNTDEAVYNCLKNVILNPTLLNEWKANTVNSIFSNEKDIEKFYALIQKCKL